MALAIVKEMEVDGLDWSGGYRPLAGRAMAEIIETQMRLAVDRHLENLCETDTSDRRNGSYRRHLLTAVGD